MPRIHADNYHDCYIDCEIGGYAVYIPPDGPCYKGCDSFFSGFAPRLARLPMDYLMGIHTNGRVWNYPSRKFAGFAFTLKRRGLPVGGAEIRELQRLASAPRTIRATGSWENQGIEGLLAVLVDLSNDRLQLS